jgi:hypothetical protein
MARPSPAAIRKTRSHPAASAAAGVGPPVAVLAPAAVASTARPTDPPTWPVVLARPPTIPASPSGTSAVAAAMSVGKASPMPTATSSVGPSTPVRGSRPAATRATTTNVTAAGVWPSPDASAL